MSITRQFHLPGITCINCVMPVENALKNCHSPQVISQSVDLVSNTITITVKNNTGLTDADITAKLKETIEDVGVECVEIDDIICAVMHPSMQQNSDAAAPPIATVAATNKKRIIRNHVIKGVIGTVVGIGLIALSLSGVVIPLAAMYAIVGVSTLLTLFLGAQSYYDAAKKLVKSKTLTMDALFAVSTLTVIGVSIASFFVPWLPMMLEAGVLIFGFRHIGKAIEKSIKNTVASGLTFKDRGARTVLRRIVLDSKISWEICPTHTIQVGDVIRVTSGNVIPVDGIAENENIAIYKTIITGATLPAFTKKGDNLYAGMKIPEEGDAIELTVTKTPADSYLSRLDTKIAHANAKKAPIETSTNKILQYFIPAVIALAAISGIIIGVLFNPALAIQCVTSLLVSACPCTLGFITPLAVKIGMAKALENGVQFKDSEALQQADGINTVVFDLNGTLTTGVPIVTNHYFDSRKIGKSEFFNCLAAIEKLAKHPIAKAICDYAGSNNTDKIENVFVEDIDQTNHAGIKATIAGNHYLIGNQQFLTDNGVIQPCMHADVTGTEQIVYIVKNNQVVGHVNVADPLRHDAKFVVKELRRMGKEVRICTGADEDTALRYARKLNIPAEHVYANCVGASVQLKHHSKTNYIAQLKMQGKRVAMIGDAANDVLAITESDFGIAVKSVSGDLITQEQAGAVVADQSLLPTVTAFAVARQTVRSIKQNLVLSLAYNMSMILIAGGILIAVGFALNPAIGVALMVLQTALILLNQYRIKREELAHLKRFQEKNEYTQELTDSSYKILHQHGISSKKSMMIDATSQPQSARAVLNQITPQDLDPTYATREDDVTLPVSPPRR